jgi:hypothetical protein
VAGKLLKISDTFIGLTIEEQDDAIDTPLVHGLG